MTNSVEPKLLRLFLLITVIGAVHMAEQLLFGIEEYYMLRDQVGRWQALFPANLQGHGTVILITLVFLLVSMLVYGALRGGRSALAVLFVFGLLGVGEVHHWLDALSKGSYDPGLITSFGFVFIGAWILRETALGLWSGLHIAQRA